MERKIKLPNGEYIPIPDNSSVRQIKEAKIITFPNGWIVKEFLNEQKVQMISYPLGMETQTEWTKDGVSRKSWDYAGHLRFRLASRFYDTIRVSHETCYMDGKLCHIGLTFMGTETLKTLHLIKKNGKVSTFVLSDTGEPKEEEIPDFPKGKRLMGIYSVSDLGNSRQRE